MSFYQSTHADILSPFFIIRIMLVGFQQIVINRYLYCNIHFIILPQRKSLIVFIYFSNCFAIVYKAELHKYLLTYIDNEIFFLIWRSEKRY